MKTKYIDGVLLRKMIIQGKNALEANKSTVDSLNVFPVPDGDTGTNMSLTMSAAAREVQSARGVTVEDIAEAAANGSLMGARGNSGVILSQLFRGFSKGCKGKEKLSITDLALALKGASDTAYKAVMKPIEGTILTVAREIGEKALEISKREESVESFLEAIIVHAERVLDKTPDMLKVLKQAGVVDAGGKGLIFIIKGFYDAVTDKVTVVESIGAIQPIMHDSIMENEEITFGYCTEFIIKGKDIHIDRFKAAIGDYGDCMLVVGDESIAKVHIHTNNPGEVIEKGLKLGELINIKIDNMRQQHQNRVFESEAHGEQTELKEYGMISVTMGKGLTDIFKDLNVDEIITGGQTMNPSTEDIKNAIDRIPAKNIFIFPNNSNIIMAANQAKELSEKNIIVIPTKTVPQGIAAVLAFNADESSDVNAETMIRTMKNVKTGQVTYSVRDTQFNDIEIKKDDILGMQDGEIKQVGSNVDEVSQLLLENMITEDTEMVTIFYGEDMPVEKAQELANKIGEVRDDIDIEVYFGGQPLYYYIFSIE